MNKTKLIGSMAAVLMGLGFSSGAFAEEGTFFGHEADGKWIIGVKAANIDPNMPDTKDATGVGIVLGYEFAKAVGKGTSTFEIEYLSGDEGQISTVNELATIPSTGQAPRLFGTYEADVINMFFTYRSPGTLYYKVKGGLSYVDLNASPVTLLDQDFEDVSFAAGIGLGYRVSDLGVVELEYSQDSGDADVGILGLNALLQF